jgi:hypothetical protein
LEFLSAPAPDTDPEGEPLEDLEDKMELRPIPPEVAVPLTLTAIILEIIKDAGWVFAF